MSGSLSKLALALSVIVMGSVDARHYYSQHPLLTAAPEVDYVELPGGGISKRLEWSQAPREKSPEELI